MIAKSNGFNGDRSAIDQAMMERCIGLSAKGIEQGEMPFARDFGGGNQSGLPSRRHNAPRRDGCDLESAAHPWPQGFVRLHALFDRRALRDVFVRGERDADWTRRFRN